MPYWVDKLAKRQKELEGTSQPVKRPEGKLSFIYEVVQGFSESELENPSIYSLSTIPWIKCIHNEGILQGSSPVSIKALFDSGATSRSYISKSFVDANRCSLTNYLKPIKASVRLGDGVHQKPIEEELNIPVTFMDSKGDCLTATVSMDVFETTMECIIGLPDILEHFFDIFIEMLHQARVSFSSTEVRGANPAQRCVSSPRSAINYRSVGSRTSRYRRFSGF